MTSALREPLTRKDRLIKQAWRDYLNRISGISDMQYEDVEPKAWNQLQRKLAKLA
jgi:hypothetical protein